MRRNAFGSEQADQFGFADESYLFVDSIGDAVVQSAPGEAGFADGVGGTSVAVVASGDQRIDGLLTGTRWSNSSISYTNPDNANDYQAGYVVDRDGNGTSAQNQGFSQISAAQLLVIHSALNQAIYTQPSGAGGLSVEGFTNLGIDFGTPGSGTAVLRYANTSDNATGLGYFPGNTIYAGDGWLGTSIQNPIQGNYQYNNTIHEIGHTLGLAHGHTGGLGGPLPSNVDSLEFTVMTYRSYIGDDTNGYNNETFGYPQTFMMLDIAALQYMYGADFTSNSGNTVYTWSTTTGDSFINGVQATDPGANRVFMTIWDGNGIDTYDLSNYSSNLVIDLAPGGFVDFNNNQMAYLGGGPNGGYARGNVFNALQYQNDARSLIENAYGGSGADTINGNAANNELRGNGGADTINGHDGNDTIYFDNLDTINGGNGQDFATAAFSGAAITIYTSFVGIEGVYGSLYNDYINAGSQSVGGQFYGYDGNDTIAGSAYADYIHGGEGDDTLYVDGTDTIEGGAGFDFATAFYSQTALTIYTSFVGIEGVYGSRFADYINAGSQTVRGDFYGYDGDDTIAGTIYADYIHGGNGNDTLYIDGLDAIVGGDGIDFANAYYSGSAVYLNTGALTIEGVYGSAYNDIINAGGQGVGGSFYGYEGNDIITSSNYADYIHGGNGFDYAAYNGQSSDYNWLFSGGVWYVGQISTGVVDELVSIEALRFLNGDVALA